MSPWKHGCLNICQPANLLAKQAQQCVIQCLKDFQEPFPSLLKTSANRTVQKQHYLGLFGVGKWGQVVSVWQAAELAWKRCSSPWPSNTRWHWWYSHLPAFPHRHPLMPFQRARMQWKTTQVFLSVVYEPKIKKKTTNQKQNKKPPKPRTFCHTTGGDGGLTDPPFLSQHCLSGSSAC